MPPKTRAAARKTRRKDRKNVTHGHAYIKSTFNNTIVSLTDPQGAVIAWCSSGQVGFKGSRKSTPYAAQLAAEAAARAEVRGLLDEAERIVDLSAPEQLVGLAGTITTVTAHALGLQAFDPQALNGAELSPQAVLVSCEAIVHSTAEQRASWGYLAPGRRDVIAAGALVWSEVVSRVVARTEATGRPLERVTTSLYDILDGIALSLVPAQPIAEGAGA